MAMRPWSFVAGLAMLMGAQPTLAAAEESGHALVINPDPGDTLGFATGPAWAWYSGAMYSRGALLPSPALDELRQLAPDIPVMAPLSATVGVHFWGLSRGGWSFASLIVQPYLVPTAPVMLGPASADAQAADGWGRPASVAFTPLVASYRINATDRIAFSLGVSATTNSYQGGTRSSNTLNVWSLVPKVAYTKEFAGADVESSTVLAVGTFSRDAVATYQNGAMGRIETLLMKREPGGWSFGGVAAAIEQSTIPIGILPGHMPGYNSVGGLAIGAGPQLNWSTHWQGSRVELQYRWIHEFRAPNGRTDQPMLLSATLHL
jgi:hypothetical protein